MLTVKLLTASAVTLAIALPGDVSPTAPVSRGVQPVVFGAPLPLDPPDPTPPPDAPVPAPDQVAAVLSQLTNPDTPDPDKATLVEGGLSADELTLLDQTVNVLNTHGELPFAFDVTDIVPAINNLAGVTVSLTGPRAPNPVVKPMVLVKQGDTWLLTHDTYDPTFIHEIKWVAWYNGDDGRRRGGGGWIGSGPGPDSNPMIILGIP